MRKPEIQTTRPILRPTWAFQKLRQIDAAKICLGLAIVFSPVRYRFVLLEQPFAPIYRDYTDLLLFLSDIFLIFTLLLWLSKLAIKHNRIKTGPPFLTLPLAGLLAISLIGVLFSVHPLLSFYHWIRLLLLAGIFLYIVNEIGSLREISWAVAALVLCQGAIAIAQVLGQRSLGLQFIGELELDPALSGISIVWTQGARSLRSYGLTDHPNILGGLLVIALLIMSVSYLKSQAGKKTPLASIYIIGMLALFLTFSRTAWLSYAIGSILLITFILHKKAWQYLADWFFLMIACVVILSPFIWNNAGYLGSQSNLGISFSNAAAAKISSDERVALNIAANEIFSKHAITGVGMGAFVIALQQEYPDFQYNYQPPHIVLLAAAAETGLLGALFVAFLLACPWLAIWIQHKRLQYSLDFIGASAALASISVVGLFDYYPWQLSPGRFWYWIVLGLWAAFYNASRR